MSPRDVALAFVAAINAHAVERLSRLMARDHRLIDSQGSVVEGQAALVQAWTQYFAMVPDYHLEIAEIVDGPPLILLGTASGTYAADDTSTAANRWRTPVAIRVAVADALVREWRIYADNEPLRALLRP